MNNTFKQMIKSFFSGGVATLVDFMMFGMLQHIVFKDYANTSFNFLFLNYSVADGGLCVFLSLAFSYLTGTVVNYFVQRAFAFNAKGTTSRRTFNLYVLSTSLVYLVVLYIPSVIGAPINALFGFILGPLISKSIAGIIGFLIQFPINKFVIFKKTSD